MFNKPGVFGRNEPVTRRDVQPVSGATPQASTVVSDKNVTALKSSPAPQSAMPESDATVASKAASSQSAASSTSLAESPASVSGKEIAAPVNKNASIAESVSDARLIVGPDVKLKGAEILDCDTLVVEGRVEATMDSRVIRIAENGSFAGKVSIDIAEIHGKFEGELTARSQLIIHSTGRVSGTIRFGTLVVDEGGELCGEINVLTDKSVAPGRAVVEPFVALGAASG